MLKKILGLCFVISTAFVSNAQVGSKLMPQMNALLSQYGAKNVSLLKYEARFGLVHQNLTGFTDHYAIRDIKKIVVLKADEGATAQFQCDATDPCISHIGDGGKSGYLSNANYYFFQVDAANRFAEMAARIIVEDFKGTPELITTKGPVDLKKKNVEQANVKSTDSKDFLRVDAQENQQVKTETTTKPKRKEVEDFLSVDAYGGNSEKDAVQELSPFGKKLMSILQLAEAKQLDKLKGGEIEGVFSSRVKLPKAKKNYLNTYKGEDCFIAEFGTKKYYEDLQDLYYEIKDEIEEALPRAYEPLDMAYEEVYENSDDEVFHTEFYNMEVPTKPSIVVRITPDGKKNTLFVRIGKR